MPPPLCSSVRQHLPEASVAAGLDPSITELPSTYTPGRVYGCFFHDDFGLSARDVIGVDQIPA